MHLPHFSPADDRLDAMLGQCTLTSGIDFGAITRSEDAETYEVSNPSDGYAFLHEAAVIEFNGVLYAAWYNCPKRELVGYTPIRGARSFDGGKTWEKPVVLVEDSCTIPSCPQAKQGVLSPTGARCANCPAGCGRILFCPPVFGIDDGKLYMLVNRMIGPDRIHALDLYLLDEQSGLYTLVWSRPIPFKLNTNVVRLDSGKLILPGRVGRLDGFPNTPAVLISDSGKIDAEWRLVSIMPDGNLPDRSKLVHPELTLIAKGEKVIAFCRNDERNVPLVFTSDDGGETWSEPSACDIPFSSSKIYAGTMADGRNYVIGNLYPGRNKLMLLTSEPGELTFTKATLIADRGEPVIPGELWHYPGGCDFDGKLAVIYTSTYDALRNQRGALISVIDIK